MARFYKLERDTLDTVAERKEGEQSDMFRESLFTVTKQTNN